MPTWCFKAAARRVRDSATLQWYWQIDTNHSLIAISSKQMFDTIQECVANARENGFRGEAAIPAALDASTVITCEEGNYVHAIVHESMPGRANRPVV